MSRNRPAISLRGELASGQDAATGQDLKPDEITVKQEELTNEYTRLGVTLAPWAFSQGQAALEGQGIENAITKASNGNYQDIINYLKKGHAKYTLWSQEGNQKAELYKTDMQSMLGIDISNNEWIGQLEELWWSVGQADIEQATEALKAGREFLPKFEDDSQTDIDPLLQEYGFE